MSEVSFIKLFIKPINITIDIEHGETVNNALKRIGIDIETPCGGSGICGSCRISAEESDKIPPTLHDNITSEEESKGIRLACTASPKSDTSIMLECNYQIRDIDNLKSRYGYKTDNNKIELEHHYKNNNIKIVSSAHNNNTEAVTSAQILNQNNNIFDQSNNIKTVNNFNGFNNLQTFADNFNIPDPKGAAIDIGTTTLVVSIASLNKGKILSSAASLNPQTIYGHDVLSRIQYASTPDKLNEIADAVRDKINTLIEQSCSEAGVKKEKIAAAVIGANTTMLEIAAKIDPTPLGHLPFKVDIKGASFFDADYFGLDINKNAQVYISPVLHAFVGSDISAGLLRCPEFFQDDKSVLYLDMGTNGEICLNVKGRRFTTSTAAGPAFEGMGISSGMRASSGAVERVELNRNNDGKFIFYVIGDNNTIIIDTDSLNTEELSQQSIIKGVCGSGIVDFTAALLTLEYLDNSGKFKMPEEEINSQREFNSESEKELSLIEHKINRVVKINSQPAFCYGENVYLTQKDIRQIQLAKGAVRTGIDLILKKGGITCGELDKIYIAGGFGSFLNPVNMEKIGLLPAHGADKVVFCGNACIDGSIMLLINHNARIFLEGTLHDMEHLQLADSPEFMQCFIKNLRF